MRSDLVKFLDLERFKSIRVKWLTEDLKPWFPYQEAYYSTKDRASIHSLFLSRVSINSFLSDEDMTTEERIRRMPPGSPRTQGFSLSQTGREVPVPSEAEMVSRLIILATGLESPSDNSRPKAKK